MEFSSVGLQQGAILRTCIFTSKCSQHALTSQSGNIFFLQPIRCKGHTDVNANFLFPSSRSLRLIVRSFVSSPSFFPSFVPFITLLAD